MVKVDCNRDGCAWVVDDLPHLEAGLDAVRQHYRADHPTKWWGGPEAHAYRIVQLNLDEAERAVADVAWHQVEVDPAGFDDGIVWAPPIPVAFQDDLPELPEDEEPQDDVAGIAEEGV